MTVLWFIGALFTIALLVYMVLSELEQGGDDRADRG